MMVMLQDYMSMHQTVNAIGQVEALRNEDSPLVKTAIAVQDLHVSLDTGSQTLAASVPMSSIEDAHASVQNTLITNATPVKLAKMKTGVSQFKTAVGKVQTARTDYSDVVSAVIEEHQVDTSLKSWGTLTQMIADDTVEFAAEQNGWFDHRFGRNIKLIAGQRLIEAGLKVTA
jgi:chaperone required for assembly of F1-ATPase